MKSITKKSKISLLSIIEKMEKGDSIKFDGQTFYIYNAEGCIIDYVNCNEN